MRRAAALAALFVMLVATGCGGTTVRRDAPVVVAGGGVPERDPDPREGPRDAVRLAVVTHGQASSPFWAIVRNGVDAASQQLDVLVNYRAPDVYTFERMETLIGQAIDSRPDGLVVSLPDPALAPAIRRAIRAGIPVITINSGYDVARRLGVVAHVGQPEERAGFLAGRRFLRNGARRALCVNQDPTNTGLNERCRGLARAMRRGGGTSSVLGIDDASTATPRRIAAAVDDGGIDAALALNGTGAVLTLQALAAQRDQVTVGTFDLGPDVLAAVRDGELAFAIDQQGYLQGYLPVVMLAQRARYGLDIGAGRLIPTGPNFVTAQDVDAVLDLSRRSIR